MWRDCTFLKVPFTHGVYRCLNVRICGEILSFLCFAILWCASFTHVLHDDSLYASCTDDQVRCPDAHFMCSTHLCKAPELWKTSRKKTSQLLLSKTSILSVFPLTILGKFVGKFRHFPSWSCAIIQLASLSRI